MFVAAAHLYLRFPAEGRGMVDTVRVESLRWSRWVVSDLQAGCG